MSAEGAALDPSQVKSVGQELMSLSAANVLSDVTLQPEENDMQEHERWTRGMAKVKQLFGAELAASASPEFQQITVEHLFGEIWTRPGLELNERSMITVAALTVLGREPQLKSHVRGALNVGISREKIQEIMIHLAHYGGWPVAVNGLRVAQEVFSELDGEKK
jgi:4-carboxymuconolactone decarboxylase